MPLNLGSNSAAASAGEPDHSRSDSERDLDSSQVRLQCKGCGELFDSESLLRRRRDRKSGRTTRNALCRGAAGPGVPKLLGSDVPVRHGTGSGRFHQFALDTDSDDYDADPDILQSSLQVNMD